MAHQNDIYIKSKKTGQEYYDLNIDMELQKDDKIFLEQQKRSNVETQSSLDPFTNEKRSQKEKSKYPEPHLPSSDNEDSKSRSPPCGYLLRGNERIYFSMSILDEPENENGKDISPSKTTLAQHKQAEHDILEEDLQLQIGNPDLKDEFMPNDEAASYDETEYMTQKEYDEYMKSLADQLKTVNSELDTAFDDVKSEFSKPSYLDTYFGLQDNEHDINLRENVSSEQMEVDSYSHENNSFGKLFSDSQLDNYDDSRYFKPNINSHDNPSTEQMELDLYSNENENFGKLSSDSQDQIYKMVLLNDSEDNFTFYENYEKSSNQNSWETAYQDSSKLKIHPVKQKMSKAQKRKKRKISLSYKTPMIVPQIAKQKRLITTTPQMLVPQFVKQDHKNSLKHLRLRDKE
jgi:hypothetical protein